MTDNAESPESIRMHLYKIRSIGVQDSAADFLREYIGVLNSAEFDGAGADMSKDAGRKFATGLYEKYLHDQRR